MKKLLLSAAMCLLASMCQPEVEEVCSWENRMEVFLEDLWLSLPCENDCLDDEDYNMLYYVFSYASNCWMYHIINAPNLGQLAKSSFTWTVTAGTNRCSQATQQSSWYCNQDTNLMQQDYPCHFYEAPYLQTYNPFDAKYQFELIIETLNGKRLIWSKVMPEKGMIDSVYSFTFSVLKNDEEPLKPQVVDLYKAPRRIYINNHFVE